VLLRPARPHAAPGCVVTGGLRPGACRQGCHVVGYFSKEKESDNDYNLACILTLPQHQRKGYGKFIISFSYELSKIEKKAGTPERPLSDLGRVSYESHWARELLHYLKRIGDRMDPSMRQVSIDELSAHTAFKKEDVKATLERLRLMRYVKGQWVININPRLVDYWLERCGGPGVTVDPDKIHWTPLITNERFV